jgi:hypothetical protein
LVATFDATVILLQSIVEIAVGAMLHASTQRCPDGTGIAVVAIRGHPVRGNIGDGLGGLEERFRGGHVTVLAKHHYDVRRILGPVQQAFTALIELFAAVATTKSAVTLRGLLAPGSGPF